MMYSKTVLVLALLALMAVLQTEATDIQVVPTLPPGIWSAVYSGGLSAVNTKTGTYTLGGNSTTFFISSLLIIPFLIAVVIHEPLLYNCYKEKLTFQV